MIGKQIIVLASLAFLAVVTLADSHAKTFEEKWADWGKNPHINQFGEFVDVDTECNGKPCIFPEEIVPYSSEELSGPFCVPVHNDRVICNYLPQNATLVSESEFDRIFPASNSSIREPVQPPKLLPSLKGSAPKPSQASQVSSASKGSVPQPSQTSQLFSVSKRSIPKPSQVSHPRLASNGTLPKHAEPLNKLEKRSRFILDEGHEHWVWPSNTKLTYGIAFVDDYKSKGDNIREAVFDSIDYWKRQCGFQGNLFFDNWQYTKEKTANIWFYFVKGVVCNKPAAFACAFFPQQYGKRTAVYVNYEKFKNRSRKAIAMIMAHEIGHVLGLAHENINKNDKGDWITLWKVSPYDKDSIMHSFFDITKELTLTDCRTLHFYNENFKTLECGMVGGEVEKCKKYRRNVVKLKDVVLNKNEVLVDTKTGHDELLEDVADSTCLGNDMSKYILNDPFSGANNMGYFNLGIALTQCLGVRVPSDPDHIYVLQSDGNFVSYNTKTGNAVPSTQSQVLGTKGDYSILFQPDGNLVIYDKNGVATWSSWSFFGSGDALRLKVADWQFHDGHMYLTDSAGRAVWGTFPALAHQNVAIQQKNPDGGASGYCVDVQVGEGVKNGGGMSYLNVCNGSDQQLWNIYTDGTIRNKRTGFCLDAPIPGDEQRAYVMPCKGKEKSQQWQLRGDGTIKNRYQNRCLDNRGQQLQVGNVVQVYEYSNVWSEKWWIGGIP